MIEPKHTFESVVRELRIGLESGTILLDRTDPEIESERRTVSGRIMLRLNGQLVVDNGILIDVAQP